VLGVSWVVTDCGNGLDSEDIPESLLNSIVVSCNQSIGFEIKFPNLLPVECFV
jgi:hypothetical protein